jgi:hypothetical protein
MDSKSWNGADMSANRAKNEQFQLRLPPGLRDRIKAYAERHGRSMNTEIVRILEREFPEPWSVNGRVAELLAMVRVLRGGVSDTRIDELVTEIEDTVMGIMTGRVRGLNEDSLEGIKAIWERYSEQIEEDTQINMEMDPEEEEMFGISGSTAKYIHPNDEEPGK